MSSPPERTFALIGINTYQSPKLKNLKGCVNDTYSMQQFLLSLRVPESNICVLKEEEATRHGIITAFESHFINNPAIRDIEPPEITGDTLIFFFAGYGSLTDAPPEWETSDGRIETICPHDEWVIGANGPINGIPSRTVHGLFRCLAAKKGNNITAVFDSCHSGRISDSRQTGSGDILIGRSVDTPCPINDPHLDEQLWTDAKRIGTQALPREFLHPSMSSHVLLAACQQEEVAYEVISLNGDPCGAFTNALITTLYKIPLHRMSYNELLNYLPPLSGQVPQCSGEHVNRTLFGAQAQSSTPHESSPSFPVIKRGDGTYEVGAGLIHGIVRGTEFVLQTADSQPGDSSWFLIADAVYLDSSTLAHRAEDPVLPEDANFSKATLSSWNNDKAILKVFIDPRQSFLVNQVKILRTDDESKAFMTKQAFARAPFCEDAHISISYEDPSEELVVERLDQIIGGLTGRTVRYSLPRNELWRLRFILESIALFRYHLLRPDCLEITNEAEAFRTCSDGYGAEVQMHLYRLGGWHEGRHVTEDDTKDFLVDNKAELQCEPGGPSEQPRYGFEVMNYTRYAFYPYLFFFDPSDYSIESWYHPFSKRMTAPLHPFQDGQPGKLTVGYGSGGGDPIVFVPETGQTRDTGFIKLFVSNVSVDMSHIQQPPATGAKENRKGFRTKENQKVWGTTLAAVTAVAAPDGDVQDATRDTLGGVQDVTCDTLFWLQSTLR